MSQIWNSLSVGTNTHIKVNIVKLHVQLGATITNQNSETNLTSKNVIRFQLTKKYLNA